MQGDLLKYLKKRYEEPLEKRLQPGPVITITRQHGCAASRVAQKLVEILSAKKDKEGLTHQWKWYSKEILDESAKQLQLNPEKIKYVFDYRKKGLLEDFFDSFSNYYQSDRKIRVTIGKVIRDIAIQGHVIIIGRGGIAITRDIPNSLHVNLEAPLDWRSEMISQKYEIKPDEAKAKAIDIDKKRQEFRDFFQGKNNDYTFPDFTINCMSFSVDEIANIITRIVEIRNLII